MYLDFLLWQIYFLQIIIYLPLVKKRTYRVGVLEVKILSLVEAGECDDGVWKDA